MSTISVNGTRKSGLKFNKIEDFHITRNMHKESRKYWNEVLNDVEKTSKTPEFKKYEILKNTLNNNSKLSENVAKLIGIKIKDDENEKLTSRHWKKKLDKNSQDKLRAASMTSISTDDYINSQKEEDFYLGSGQLKTYQHYLQEIQNYHSKDQNNGLPERTSIIKDNNQTKTNKVISAFMEKIDSSCSDLSSMEDLKNLFDVMSNMAVPDCRKPIQIRKTELNAIHYNLARENNLYQYTHGVMLYKQIYRDVAENEFHMSPFAFGTALPQEIRQYITPAHKWNPEDWVDCKRVPEKLRTMATVWEGIEKLRSTEGFCEYLRKGTLTDPPQYLVKVKLLPETKEHEKHRAKSVMRISAPRISINSRQSVQSIRFARAFAKSSYGFKKRIHQEKPKPFPTRRSQIGTTLTAAERQDLIAKVQKTQSHKVVDHLVERLKHIGIKY